MGVVGAVLGLSRPSRILEDNSFGSHVGYGGPLTTFQRRTILAAARDHSWDILAKNVIVAFCLYPKNLPYTKLKSNELIFFSFW